MRGTVTSGRESRLARCAALYAAADRRDDHALRQAAESLRKLDGPGMPRELLRYFHLFRGFPAALRALERLGPEALGPAPAEPEGAARNPDRERGERVFRRLYGSDADTVLPHLRKLDPSLSAWVLDHAYGRVMPSSRLSRELRERLAVLLLAADACWKQCDSHLRICLRLGIANATLRADAFRVPGWPSPSRARRLRQRIQELDV